MSIFASVDPDTFTSDPAPWALVDFDYSVTRITHEERGFEWAPREEYRPATAHPANPVLVAFRRGYNPASPDHDARTHAWAAGIDRVATILGTGNRNTPATPASRRIDQVLDSVARDATGPADARARITEAIDHARKVISRLDTYDAPVKRRSTFIPKQAA